jgi:hypothetical protein
VSHIVTVTVVLAVTPPLVTDTTVVPGLRAVTTPALSTVATRGSSAVHTCNAGSAIDDSTGSTLNCGPGEQACRGGGEHGQQCAGFFPTVRVVDHQTSWRAGTLPAQHRGMSDR